MLITICYIALKQPEWKPCDVRKNLTKIGIDLFVWALGIAEESKSFMEGKRPEKGNIDFNICAFDKNVSLAKFIYMLDIKSEIMQKLASEHRTLFYNSFTFHHHHSSYVDLNNLLSP